MPRYEEATWSDGDLAVTVAKHSDRFAFHRLEVDADQSYRIDLWKDGTVPANGSGSRYKEVTDPGYYMDIAVDGDEERVTLRDGRDDATSHYADITDFDDRLLDAVEDAVVDRMAAYDETDGEGIGSFFDALRQDRFPR